MKPVTALSAAVERGLGWWKRILHKTPLPLGAFGAYVDGFHFARGDLSRQIEVHHYCAHLDEDFIQCVLFDGNTPNARLIGVEYIVSERLFATFPHEERRLWHSHRYEVKSGLLLAPDMPEAAEHALMEKLVSTYGKTWHTWNTDCDALPLGTPELMMGFTADGQVREALTAERDRRLGISSAERRKARADVDGAPVLPGADSRGPAPGCSLRR